MYTRRAFAKTAAALLPTLSAWSKVDSKVNGVPIGVQSYSFRDLPPEGRLEAIVKNMTNIGLGECEMYNAQAEPPSLNPPGGRGQDTPERAAARAKAREELRKWRLSVSDDHFKAIRKQFEAAGLRIHAYNYSFNDSFTDDEITRGFEIAKAIGAKVITASTTVSVARRVAPFADKHKQIVAMHNHSNVKDPNEFATPESFKAAMDLSKYFWVNLDIGHFVGADFDPIAYIQQHHARITNLHLKDRKKNQGPNMPWGEGDTPIREVLRLLRDKKYAIPAYIEYEYRGTESSAAEVTKCFDFCKRALT